jgi:predicted MPP superfamily phosphohydrolase
MVRVGPRLFNFLGLAGVENKGVEHSRVGRLYCGMNKVQAVLLTLATTLAPLGCATSKGLRLPAVAPEYQLEICNISDAHVIVPTEKNTWRLSRDGVEILRDTLRRCQDTDLILLSGDVIEGKFEGMKSLQLAYEMLSQSKVPWWVVPGNHDGRYTKKDNTVDEFNKVEFFRKFKGHGPNEDHGYWSHAIPGKKISIIGVDTSIEGSSYGKVDNNQLQWLDQTLSDLPPDQLAILVMHHPIVLFNPVILDSDKKELDHFVAQNHDQVRRVVERHGDHVKVVISGHTHSPEYLELHGVHYISTPSINTWPNRFTRYSLHAGTLEWEHLEISAEAKINEAWENLSSDSPFLKALKSKSALREYFTHGPLRGSIHF